MVATERVMSEHKNAELSIVAAVVALVLPLIDSPLSRGLGVLAFFVAVFFAIAALRSNRHRGLAVSALCVSVFTVCLWITVSVSILNTHS
jgi:hypothetical protein